MHEAALGIEPEAAVRRRPLVLQLVDERMPVAYRPAPALDVGRRIATVPQLVDVERGPCAADSLVVGEVAIAAVDDHHAELRAQRLKHPAGEVDDVRLCHARYVRPVVTVE